MINNTTSERAAFETHMRGLGYSCSVSQFKPGYMGDNVEEMWRVWQARAAMQTAESVGPLVGCGDGNTRIVLAPPTIRKSRTVAAPDRAPTAEPVAGDIAQLLTDMKAAPIEKMREGMDLAIRALSDIAAAPARAPAAEPVESNSPEIEGIGAAPDRTPSIDSAAESVIDSEAVFKASADSVNRTWNAAYRAGQADSAADAKDAARWRYIEEHATSAGGGKGFMISCWVPIDHEDIGCGIDAAIAAMPPQEQEQT